MNIKFISLIFVFNLINLSSALKSSTECNHLQPFMFNKLALGIDLTKLNLFPEKGDFFSRNGFKDTLFNFTCYQNVNFKLQNMVIPNEIITYYLPDHMSAKFDEKNYQNMITHRTFEDDEEAYKRNMMSLLKTNNLTVEEKLMLNEFHYDTSNIDELYIGAFKLSNNYGRIRKERLSNRRIATESRINITGYLINLDESKMALTNAFQNEIANLPINYEDNRSKYENMIHTFGTHYFTQYSVGGLAKVSFKIIDEAPVQLDQLSEFENDKPFGFDLNGLEFDVDENMGSNIKYFKTDDVLHKRTISFYGGRIESKNHTLRKWKRTVALDPWLIGGQVAPLSRLIKDKRKKRNFLKGMMSYLDKAEILNLEGTVNLIKEEMKDASKWILPYKVKVEELNERVFINHTNLVDFSNQLNDEISFQLKRRSATRDPFKIGIYSSSLDGEEKQVQSNHIKFSSYIFWYLLIFLIALISLFILSIRYFCK